MKNKTFLVTVALAIILTFTGAGIVTLTGIGQAKSTGTSVYEQGGIDTVKWAREAGVVGLAFSVSSSDTVNIQNIIVKRVINNQVIGNAVVTADTLAGAAVSGVVPVSAESSATAASYLHSVTMTPYAENYWFIVKYATGVTFKNGSGANDSTFIATYGVHKQYSK